MDKTCSGVQKAVPAKKQIPTVYLQSWRRSMFKGIYEYAECLEDEIDDLHHFHTWEVPILNEHETKIGRLTTELHDLRNLVKSGGTGNSNGCGKETGVPSSGHRINDTREHVANTSPITPLNQHTVSNNCSGNAAPARSTENREEVRKHNVRDCYIPYKHENFDLKFKETATQAPDAWYEGGDGPCQPSEQSR